jgi:anti-sigma B factor antagonist
VIGGICEVGGITVVDIEGRFDALSAPKTKAELHQLIEGGSTKLVLNLQKMDFIDSAGLGVLVSCLRKAAAEGGDLRVAEVPPFCRSIFELTRLTRVFDVTQSAEQAMRAVAEGEAARGR